jgi:hypothetical protein
MKLALQERAERASKWVKENKVITLLIAALTGIVLLGNAADGIRKVISPFVRASTDATEVAKIRRDVEQQRDAIAVVARDANASHQQIEEAKAKADEASRRTADIEGLAKEAATAVRTITASSDSSFLLARNA